MNMISKVKRKLWSGGPKRKVMSVASALVLVAGVAFAAWMLSAQGQAGGRIGSLQNPVITAGTPASALYPGQSAAGSLHISNPNEQALTLTSVGPGNGDVSGFDASCPATYIGLASPTGLTITVPPGAGDVEVPNLFSLASNAPQSCAGKSFSVNVAGTFKLGS
ncbi:MAG: hypothetical protein V7607_1219 [Solirubrobacteraceae bacterium]